MRTIEVALKPMRSIQVAFEQQRNATGSTREAFGVCIRIARRSLGLTQRTKTQRGENDRLRRSCQWHRADTLRRNSPFYGVEAQGWFLSFHCFTKYVKVAFFNGASLRPLPPGASKSDSTRYLDVHEHDSLDETQLAAWVKQAAALPGWGKS